MLSAVPLWLHILGAAVWVGSQVMMFAVVVPSLRQADDALSRHQVLTSVTRRFGYLGFGALALLILTGIDNIDRYSPAEMFDFRYGYILTVKLLMLAAVLALTAAHTLVVGPKLLRAQSLGNGAPASEARALRRNSVLLSVATLLLSLAIVFCAALLRSQFAYGGA